MTDPATVIQARNGFIYSLADGGNGTFPGDKREQMDRAGGFFDDMAEEGFWTDSFYNFYADQWNHGRPWEASEKERELGAEAENERISTILHAHQVSDDLIQAIAREEIQ